MFGFRTSQGKDGGPRRSQIDGEADAILLVDVREDGEWAAGRIAGAVHAPLSRLRTLAAGLPTGKPIVFYCLSGARSGQAIAVCRALGLPHDTHMAGGVSAWRAHGFPLVR